MTSEFLEKGKAYKSKLNGFVIILEADSEDFFLFRIKGCSNQNKKQKG